MRPIPQDKLNEVLIPIFKEGIEDVAIAHRTSPEYCVGNVEKGYEARAIAAYVDDLESPKCCLVVAMGRSPVLDENLSIIYRIWVRPDLVAVREGVALSKEMAKTFEAYAEMNGADGILASSWVYRNAPDIGSFWEKLGFEIQEKIYIKHLNK